MKNQNQEIFVAKSSVHTFKYKNSNYVCYLLYTNCDQSALKFHHYFFVTNPGLCL